MAIDGIGGDFFGSFGLGGPAPVADAPEVPAARDDFSATLGADTSSLIGAGRQSDLGLDDSAAPIAAGGGTPVAHDQVDPYSDAVKQMQLKMQAAGIDPGPIDGLKGPLTRAAMKQYEAKFGKSAAEGLGVNPDWAELAGGAAGNAAGNAKPRDGMAPGTPDGPGQAAPDVKGSGAAGQAAEIAKKYLGTPYAFGGSGPGGFDCSGIVQYAFKQAGINLPRSAAEQYNATQPVNEADAKPGDLVFLKNTYKQGVSHVGIYLGNGKMLEAPKTGDVVKITSINDAYKRQHWAGIRRAA